MSQMKWTDGCDALVDFVEEHGGSMGGEMRDHLFNIMQNIIDGQVVGCNLDGDGYCATHASWRCFPNLGEVAGTKKFAPSGPLSDPEGEIENESPAPSEPSIYSHDENDMPDMDLPGMWTHSDYEGGRDEVRSEVSGGRQEACPTNHGKNHPGSGRRESGWDRDYADYAFCPDCGAPLSEPQTESPAPAPSVGELEEAIEVLQSLEPRRRHLERMTGNQKFDWENGWNWGIDDAINVLQRILSGAAEEASE